VKDEAEAWDRIGGEDEIRITLRLSRKAFNVRVEILRYAAPEINK